MPRAGHEISGPDGFRLRFVRMATETGGELLEMEATYGGTGALPPAHAHPSQAERFEVLEGSVRAIVDGTERSYSVGETFDVPAGTTHQMAATEAARVRWEVRPALRTAELFECLHGDGPGSLRGGRSVADLLAEFSAEIRLT